MEEKKAMVKVEGNIIEYPFFHLGGKRKKTYTKEYDLGEIKLDDGLTAKRKLLIDNYKYGIPGPYDQDVLMGILRIGTKKNKITEEIPTTIYEVAKEIDDLKNWIRVKNSIERLITTNYRSKQVLLVKETERNYYLDDMFHILENVSFFDKETHGNTKKSNEITKIKFNSFFINNFLNDYYKYIDLKKYFEIGSPTAKKLYLYLEKKKYKKEVYQIKLENLACILPLEVKELYRIRWILKKAHEKLIEHSVIKSFEYNKEKVIYYFPTAKKEDKTLNIKNNDIIEELIEMGITKIVAEEIFEKQNSQKIKEQIEYLKYRKGNNLQGILIRSIKEDWAAPQGYLNEMKIREEKEKQRIERQIEKEKIEKEEEKEEYINKILSDLTEEKIKEYNLRAEEYFDKSNPELSKKYFHKAYRNAIIRKLILEDKGIITLTP